MRKGWGEWFGLRNKGIDTIGYRVDSDFFLFLKPHPRIIATRHFMGGFETNAAQKTTYPIKIPPKNPKSLASLRHKML